MRVENLAILNNAYSNDGTFMQYRGMYKFNTTYNGFGYIHMKTNINTVNNMWMFEAIGYNYGYAGNIRCGWVVHKSGSTLYYTGTSFAGFGLNANTPYLSTDGYIVLVANRPSLYYVGFVLNAYNTADVYDQSSLENNKVPTVTASAISSSSTGVY